MNFCNEDFVRVYQFCGFVLNLLKLAVPIIIIVMGTMDLFKSVVDKDENSLSKQIKILLIRIAAGLFIFFLPSIVLFLTQSIGYEQNKFSCVYTCILDTGECKVISSTQSLNNNNIDYSIYNNGG